jgi:hypothetical protein
MQTPLNRSGRGRTVQAEVLHERLERRGQRLQLRLAEVAEVTAAKVLRRATRCLNHLCCRSQDSLLQVSAATAAVAPGPRATRGTSG